MSLRTPFKVAKAVASDFYGGIELMSAAFKAVMLAVASNLLGVDAELLRVRTSSAYSARQIGSLRAHTEDRKVN